MIFKKTSLIVLSLGFLAESGLATQTAAPDFIPPAPVSEYLADESASAKGTATLDFCAEWNPEFPYNGHRCCRVPGKSKRPRQRNRGAYCYSKRWKQSYCEEMTGDQKDYSDRVVQDRNFDVLAYLQVEINKGKEQAFCSVNNGFLAHGRPVVPTEGNRIVLRNADRCTSFGTDPMVAMIEWLGQQVDKEYPTPEFEKVGLLVGDISSPRGGCLPGLSGLKGHASHTSGKDVDLGFIIPHRNIRTPASFYTQFEPKANWWFVKQIFKNPYACVKVIFLDRSHIRKLQKAARGDEDWAKYGRFLRHIRSHKNHYHIRIGDGPGQPGCSVNAQPELETEEDVPLDVEIPEEVDANRGPTARITSKK